MAILIQYPTEPVLKGILDAIVKTFSAAIIWDTRYPLNDMLDFYKPDIVFVYSSNIKHEIDNAKLVILGDSKINASLICVNDSNQSTIPNRYKIEPAANFLTLPNYNNNYTSDVFYHSQYPQSVPLQYLQTIEKDYQLKIIGQHRLPLTSYLGIGTEIDVLQCLTSCKIALAFDIHTLYTYAANKIFCLHNQESSLFRLCKDIDSFVHDIDYYIQDRAAGFIQEYIDSAYNDATQQTYFHRLNDIFNLIDEPELAQQCLNKLNFILKT